VTPPLLVSRGTRVVPITVFVVEDDPSVRPALARLLRTEGLVVETFASAEEFLAHEGSSPGCLILDIYLPGITGLELYREIRRRGRAMPVVFITAHDDPGLRTQALRAQAVALLQKPFQEEELLDAVDRAVRAVESSS
jgi:FixJ family two-component response regulator